MLDQSYHWTPAGNLEWRTDETLDMKESFGYDGFNRLVSATTRNLAETQTYSSQSFGYDFRGNITQKSGVGNYAYNNNSNPYAVTKLIPENGQESLFKNQTATYTGFDKLRSLEQYNKRLVVDYGIDRQRVRQTFRRGSSTRTKRHFTPLYESITENGVTKNLHYLTAGTGLFAIFATQTNGESAMHYTLKDHQGSLTATICGDAVERLSYDAWGNMRDPETWLNYSATEFVAGPMFDRGYTGHEHISAFGLINMNGRCYDPVTSSSLSVDRFVQSPDNSQSFNRYAYCMYNPLRYIDPSGWAPREPGNGQPGDPPGLGNYHPGIYNPTDSESAWLVRLPDVDVIATSLGSNANTTITPYTEGTIWDNNHYLDKPKDTGPVLYETPIGHGGSGGGIGTGPNNHWGNSKLTPSVVNNVVTGAGTITGYQKSLWEKPKSRAQKAINQKKAYETQKALKQKGITKSVKEIKAAKIANLKAGGYVLGAIGIGLSGYDIIQSGEINVSNGYYAGVAILSTFVPGAGWIIGGVALTLDLAFYGFTGESFGDNLSHWFGDPSREFRK